MKKTFSILLASSAAFALAACAEAEPVDETDGEMVEESMEAEASPEAAAEGEAEDNNDGLDGTGNPIGPAAAGGDPEASE